MKKLFAEQIPKRSEQEFSSFAHTPPPMMKKPFAEQILSESNTKALTLCPHKT